MSSRKPVQRRPDGMRNDMRRRMRKGMRMDPISYTLTSRENPSSPPLLPSSLKRLVRRKNRRGRRVRRGRKSEGFRRCFPWKSFRRWKAIIRF